MKMKTLSAAIALAVLAGCASVPPDRAALAQRDAAQAALAPQIKLAREGWPAAQWWTQYGDTQLNALLSQALQDSPSLGVAKARIASANAQLAFERADTTLDADLVARADHQRYSGTGLFPEPIGGSWFTGENIQLQTRYDLDWWGRRKAQISSTLGELNARRAEAALAEQVLAAELVRSYFAMQAARARSSNLEALERVQQQAVADIEKRIAAGLSPQGEVQTARQQLSEARQQRLQLDAQAAREQEAVRALVGGDVKVSLETRPMPAGAAALPAQLGLELLAHRADLQAARWRVESALSRIEVARAAFYPQVAINASLGLDTISLPHLLEWASRTAYIGPTLTLPVFDAKRLEAKLEGSRKERDELVADYNQRLVDAVRIVAQAAIDVRGLDRETEAHIAAVDAADALLRGAQTRVQQGLADRRFELNAQANVLRQQDATLQLQARHLAAEVALTRALGGGYQTN